MIQETLRQAVDEQKIGKYEIERAVAWGKLSQVFRAYDAATGERIFLETAHDISVSDDKFRMRFAERIDTIRQLNHPHLAQYLDWGISEDERPFAILSPMSGKPLNNWVQENLPQPVEALRIVRQIAAGLVKAHAAGIIHGDIRPEMIFVTPTGEAVLLGLGLFARNRPETAVSFDAAENPVELLDYPAPEVLEGKPPASHSNIYSLGIILYELLAETRPHLPVSSWDIFDRQTIPQPIPLEQARPGLTPETYQVVKTSIWWQPWNRYQTIEELVEALDRAIAAEEAKSGVTPAKSRRNPRLIYGAAAAVLLIVVLAAGWLLLRNRDGGSSESTAVAVNDPIATQQPTLAPDDSGEQIDPVAVVDEEPTSNAELAAVLPSPTPTATASPTPLPSPTTLPPTATAVPPTATPTPIPLPEDMMLIPAGTFIMGSNEGVAIEGPAHEVRLSSYLLDQFEVSNEQYRACVENGACTQTSFPNSFTVSGYRDELLYNDYPIVGVTWDQAFFYCNWAGKRLPTEAEWEYAARGPENLQWPWGNSFDPSLSAASAADVRPVDSYPKGVSPFGIYNMAGNVAEWVVDVYDGNNFYANSPVENPVNMADGLDRVFRGGSFDNVDGSAYLAYRRYAQLRTFTDVDIGFRCAADAPTAP